VRDLAGQLRQLSLVHVQGRQRGDPFDVLARERYADSQSRSSPA
jgi:hypothetical protein